MFKIFLKIVNPFIFNLTLLVFLFLAVQNSQEKHKVFFLNYESTELPLSFILGSSFIFGSLCSNILLSSLIKKTK